MNAFSKYQDGVEQLQSLDYVEYCPMQRQQRRRRQYYCRHRHLLLFWFCFALTSIFSFTLGEK